MISARIIADSINPNGDRLTSFILTYPRFIHSELMTHRVFSRNAASSRAIPLNKMIEAIETETAKPVIWGAKQASMKMGDEVYSPEACNVIWEQAMDEAIFNARLLDDQGVHKSISNRLLEPFAHMTTLVTATEFNNFFHLRAHEDADKTFQVLAFKMLDEYLTLKPLSMKYGEWHIPHFGPDKQDARTLEIMSLETRLKVVTARCARISYLTFDGEFSIEKDIELHDRLMSSGHWSPFEHCAKADDGVIEKDYESNFNGWLQYRKQFRNENITEVDLEAIRARKPTWLRSIESNY